MTAIEKSLSEIETDDLEELVELNVQEGKGIEYKEYLDLSDDENDHKAKFVDEVTSFANDQGGDLLVGVPDDDGAPKGAGGFPLEKSADDTINKWQSVIRRHTDPTLPAAAFDIRAISTEDNRAVIIVRVERS